jgi:hypothetical protein
MTVIGALSSFRELVEISPHKRACIEWSGHLPRVRNRKLPETVVGNVNSSFLRLSTESPTFPYLKKSINIGKMKLGHSFHCKH